MSAKQVVYSALAVSGTIVLPFGAKYVISNVDTGWGFWTAYFMFFAAFGCPYLACLIWDKYKPPVLTANEFVNASTDAFVKRHNGPSSRDELHRFLSVIWV